MALATSLDIYIYTLFFSFYLQLMQCLIDFINLINVDVDVDVDSKVYLLKQKSWAFLNVAPYFLKYRGSLIKLISGWIWAGGCDQYRYTFSWHLSLKNPLGKFWLLVWFVFGMFR